MQVELLDRRRWKTRIEIATAIHDYIELWHNPRRRHSALKMRTPDEVEAAWLEANNASTTADPGRHDRAAAGASEPAVTMTNDKPAMTQRAGGWQPVVPGAWWHANVHACSAVGAVSAL